LHPRGTGLSIIYPKPTSLPKPPFPPAARAVRAKGDVMVAVQLDASAQVISAQALSGHPLLRKTSEQAAKGARFESTVDKKASFVVLVYRYKDSNETVDNCCDSYPYIISVLAPELHF